ncbi:MAG: glycoside hydrolase family 3 N-terminal domain-containing protein [Hyphomicrobiaceae bacterium]
MRSLAPPSLTALLISLGTAALGAIAVALLARTVWLASVRAWVLGGGVIVSALIALALAGLLRRRPGGASRIGGGAVLVLWIGCLTTYLWVWHEVHTAKHRVLDRAGPSLATVGRHVMAGYRDLDELRRLVEAGAVGGVFVTARNAAGKSEAQLADEIAGLQAIAHRSGLGPLIVATDQEGGMVSRLSPPLPRPAPLSEIVRRAPEPEARDRAVRELAMETGRALARVGVTLNFAPVADLDFGIRDPADRLSRIGERAISSDGDIAGAVAAAYCEGLLAEGVLCTLKHFPGLGRVRGDTHIASARLAVPVAELEGADWRPFRRAIASGAAVMMAHVIVEPLDAVQPASSSRPVIDGILRRAWGFDGMVVTDDLTMIAATSGEGGLGGAGTRALAAGADLLLVAYDTDQVYPLLLALLEARERGEIGDDTLAASRLRLERHRSGRRHRQAGP